MRRVSAPEQVVRQWTPSPRELDDLELIGMGVLPVDGFSAPTSGDVPALTLTVPRDLAAVDELELLDPEGLPLARVRVEETYADGDAVGVVGAVRVLIPDRASMVGEPQPVG